MLFIWYGHEYIYIVVYSNVNIIIWLAVAVAGILALSVTIKLLLTALPDPSSLQGHWYYKDDWIGGQVPWDTFTWQESFRPSDVFPYYVRGLNYGVRDPRENE